MIPSDRYNVAALCAFINSGNVRLPLSHTRSLQVIAALEGEADWFALAHRDDANSLKARAKVLRAALEKVCPPTPLTDSAAAGIIDAILNPGLAVPLATPGVSVPIGAAAADPTTKSKLKRTRKRTLPATA